jgi:hypothetical protein
VNLVGIQGLKEYFKAIISLYKAVLSHFQLICRNKLSSSSKLISKNNTNISSDFLPLCLQLVRNRNLVKGFETN